MKTSKRPLFLAACALSCVLGCGSGESSNGEGAGNEGSPGPAGDPGPRGEKGERGDPGLAGVPRSKADVYVVTGPAVTFEPGGGDVARAYCADENDVLLSGGCEIDDGWAFVNSMRGGALDDDSQPAYWECSGGTNGGASHGLVATAICVAVE